MRFDDDPTTSTPEAGDEAPGRARRRAARPWSNPSPVDRAGADRPVSDPDWGTAGGTTTARPRPPMSPPILPSLGMPTTVPEPVDLTPVLSQLAALQAQVTALQASVDAAAEADEGVVTGAELAAAIEQLGAALGGGMATLLTEHRNLLARDLTQAADRILEELGVRLRAASSQTADVLEERVRHIVAKALAEMSEQVELRLDKVQGDVAGLRAVMLDLPDQTPILERLDQLSEAVADSGKVRTEGRTGPAVTAAIERSVAGPLERLEEQLSSVADVVRDVLDERIPEGGTGGGDGRYPDADTIEALTKEITLLRRRIAVRAQAGDDLGGAAEEPTPSASVFDEEPPIELTPPPPPPAPRAARAAKPKAAPVAKAPARGRRSRRID